MHYYFKNHHKFNKFTIYTDSSGQKKWCTAHHENSLIIGLRTTDKPFHSSYTLLLYNTLYIRRSASTATRKYVTIAAYCSRQKDEESLALWPVWYGGGRFMQYTDFDANLSTVPMGSSQRWCHFGAAATWCVCLCAQQNARTYTCTSARESFRHWNRLGGCFFFVSSILLYVSSINAVFAWIGSFRF